MREIKFEYMLIKDGIVINKQILILEDIEQKDSNEFCYELLEQNEKVIKRQYTGLKDAINKSEVYEHDIINFLGVGFLKVEWDYKDTGWICLDKRYKKRSLVDVLLSGGIKVGNIYETPELLENNK